MTLDEILRSLNAETLLDERVRGNAHQRWASRAHPLEGLGILEEIIEDIAALTGTSNVRVKPRMLLVLCASNGVIARQVAQSTDEVTRAVVSGLAEGRSSVCVMARVAHCEVVPVDMGVVGMKPQQNLLIRRIGNGANDISQGPAMTRHQAIDAIETGIDLVREAKKRGVALLATGEMGIGNTTTTAAVTAALLGLEPETVVGRGAGLDDSGLFRKRAVVRDSLALNHPQADDPLDVLSKVGGFDLAGLTGVYLGCAFYRIPVLLDGVITLAAALCACRLAPVARQALIATHASAEPATQSLVNELHLKPFIYGGFHLGEGTGAMCALPMLDMAVTLYREGATFDDYNIVSYKPWDR